jgi:hypothetical protein
MTVNVIDYIRKGAEKVADAARSSAGRWSRRIPAATDVEYDNTSVSVVTRGDMAPQARAFEEGIRHPLNYPNQRKHDYFARTPKRAYMYKAWVKTQDYMEDQMVQYVDDLAKEKLGG